MLQGEHSAILSTFFKISFVVKIFVLPIFEWPLKTGLTLHKSTCTIFLILCLLQWEDKLKVMTQLQHSSISSYYCPRPTMDKRSKDALTSLLTCLPTAVVSLDKVEEI